MMTIFGKIERVYWLSIKVDLYTGSYNASADEK